MLLAELLSTARPAQRCYTQILSLFVSAEVRTQRGPSTLSAVDKRVALEATLDAFLFSFLGAGFPSLAWGWDLAHSLEKTRVSPDQRFSFVFKLENDGSSYSRFRLRDMIARLANSRDLVTDMVSACLESHVLRRTSPLRAH